MFFDPDHPTEAVRVAGRLTCRHLPWYRDRKLPKEEEQFYRRTEQFSYYSRTSQMDSVEPYDEANATPDAEQADETYMRAYLTALYRSNSWRLTRPLRTLAKRLGGPVLDDPAVEHLQYSEHRPRVEGLTASASWRLTQPLRAVSLQRFYRRESAD